MEKETERGTYVLKEDEKLGAVQIADDVVAMIASLASKLLGMPVRVEYARTTGNAIEKPVDLSAF